MGGVAAIPWGQAAASYYAPREPKGTKRAAGSSDIAIAAEDLRGPRRPRRVHMFSSGGHSGQIYVYGVPSMRHLSTIPVFTPYPATGKASTTNRENARKPPWGDAHHPALSETKGDYDGRWLFVNEMNGASRASTCATSRPADHRPRAQHLRQPRELVRHAEHGVRGDGRPVLHTDADAVAGIDKCRPGKGVLVGVKIDAKSGEMSLGWEIMMPPFDYDLGDAGKNVSDGWVFFTSYNSERAGKLK